MANQYPTGLAGWLYMTAAEYASGTHNSSTKYTVRDAENNIREYLGDIEITSEEGSAWVTMTVYQTDMQVLQDVISSINDRVNDLETWKSQTVTPWMNAMQKRMDDVEKFEDTIVSEFAPIKEFIDEFDYEAFKTWKENVSKAFPDIYQRINENTATIAELKARIIALETALAGHKFWDGTQAEYDALSTVDSKTQYMIVG